MSPAATKEGEPEMLVPGGRAALARFLGAVDERPEHLSQSANKVLLDGLSRRNEWQEVSARVDLSIYVEIATELHHRAAKRDLVLQGEQGRRSFLELCTLGGYLPHGTGAAAGLDPAPGDEAATRRRAFQALGWNLAAIALRLDANAAVVLRLPDETAVPLIPLEEWSVLAGAPVKPGDALERFARDQQAGLFAAAWTMLDAETRAAFPLEVRRSLYARAPAFYRYGASFRVRDGRLVVPGGPDGERAWSALIGVPLDAPAPFVVKLLEDPPAAYLWHALTFAPVPVATALAGHGDDGAQLARVLAATRRLARWAFFDSARGADPLLPALLRALPVDPQSLALTLPGGSAAWSAALRGETPPSPGGTPAPGTAADTAQFVIDLLTDKVKTGPIEHSLVRRCLVALEIFERRPDLATPANVAIVSRSIERYPGALDALDYLPMARAESVHSYLLEVARLDEYRAGTDVFVGMATFEGGVELLRQLARAGRVPAADVDRLFEQWITLHTTAKSPAKSAKGVFLWLDDLAHALPPAPDDAPGRGPAERALLARLAPETDPQCFTFQGLEYCGQRALTRAAAMADDLERQGIASLDALLEIGAGLAALRTDDRGLDQTIAHVTALPRVAVPDSSGAGAWFEPQERDELLAKLADLRGLAASKRQKRIDALFPLLAQELRPFFVAPAYLPALAESVRLLADDPSLVRRHTVVRRLDTVVRQQDGGDTPWQHAVLVPAADGRMARIAGHVARSAAPLGLFQYGVPPGENARRRYGTELAREWFGAVAAARWERVTPAALEAIVVLDRAGRALVTAAAAEPAAGRTRTFVERRVAPWRLTPGAPPVGPAERILLALAAIEGDGAGPANADLVPAGDRAALQRLAEASVSERPVAAAAPLSAIVQPLFDGPVRADAYETLVTETGFTALHDRERLDLRLTVALYLGRMHLPGVVGQDLFARTVAQLPARLELASSRDWSSFAEWLSGLDGAFFDERMRQCFASRLYSVR